MKITIVSLQFEKTATGGGGVHVENITEQFLKLGYQVYVLSIHTNKTINDFELLNDWQTEYSIEKRNNLTVIRFLIDKNIENPYVGDKITELDRILRFANTVYQWIIEHPEDHNIVSLHGHHIIPGWLAKQLRQKVNLITSTIHALESTYVTANGIGFGNFEATKEMINKLQYYEAMAVYADYIIINSLKVKNDFMQIAENQGYKKEDFYHKLILIASGVTMDFIMSDKQIKEKLSKEPQVVKILTFSRIDPSKGHEFAILGTFEAAKKFNKKFKLFIVGIPESEEYVKKLKSIAANHPDNVEVFFDFKTAISPVEEKKQILDDKHIYILASLQEPFGMSIVEASARGNMIISNDTTGPMYMMEVEKKGQETHWGYITPYGTLAKLTNDPYSNLPKNIGEAIKWTINSWNEGAQRVININKRVRKLWTWEGIAHQYIELFSKFN